MSLALEWRAIVVEASSGYGKTVFAGQVRQALGVASAALSLRTHDSEASVLAGTLYRSLRAANLSDLASAVEGRDDLSAGTDALFEALAAADEPVLLVVDDAHHAGSEATGAFLDRLASELPTPHRVMILARSLPDAAAGMRFLPRTCHISNQQLAFTPGEIDDYLRTRFSVDLPPHTIETVHRATAGWPAAVALWAPLIAAAPEPLAAVEAVVARAGPLGVLVNELLERLPQEDRAPVAQLGHLPLISPDLVDGALLRPGLLKRAAEVGFPVSSAEPGWSKLPDPVAEHLAGLAPLDPITATGAARVYAAAGQTTAALWLLLSAGLTEAAVQLLAGLPGRRLEQLNPGEAHAIVAEFPQGSFDTHARALLQLARVWDTDAYQPDRKMAIAQLLSLPSESDPQLRREAQAEHAHDLIRSGQVDSAGELAAAVLAEAGPDEQAARARALGALARVVAIRGPDDQALERATELYRAAAAAASRAGFVSWAVFDLIRAAEDGLRERCRFDQAVAVIDEALGLAQGSGRTRAVALTSRADTLGEAGRLAEAEASLAESRTLGRLLGDVRALSYAAWAEMLLAVILGDQVRALAAVAVVEEHRGDWFESFSGVGFLTDCADALDRLGLHDQANGYLERARPLAAQDPRQFACAEAMLAGRSGDPVAADRLIEAALAMPVMSPRRRWRLRFLRAAAALRRGDQAARALAADAFEYCAALGVPEIPLRLERVTADLLLPLAAEAGSRSAAQLAAGARRLSVQLLGGFEVRRGGAPVELPAGRPEMAVKAVAASGRMTADALIEVLWPEVDPDTGRARLRNVLSRIRSAAGELLVRAGDDVELGPDVEVDARLFADEANRALSMPDALRANALARSALARYTGPLLPGNVYDAWATEPRETLRSQQLQLLDLVAAEAEAQQRVDEAVRFLDRAIAVEPYDENRYLRAARLRASQGRVGSARALLDRARRALVELGLEPAFGDDDFAALGLEPIP